MKGDAPLAEGGAPSVDWRHLVLFSLAVKSFPAQLSLPARPAFIQLPPTPTAATSSHTHHKPTCHRESSCPHCPVQPIFSAVEDVHGVFFHRQVEFKSLRLVNLLCKP